MSRILGMTLLMCLTGCATTRMVPTAIDTSAELLAGSGPAHSSGPTRDFDLLTVRVGVEYLPEGAGSGPVAMHHPGESGGALPTPSFRVQPRIEQEPDPVRVIPLRGPARAEVDDLHANPLSESWIFESPSEAEIEGTYENIHQRFLVDVFGEDRRRMHRQFGSAMMLTRGWNGSQASLRSSYDDRYEDEQAIYNDRALRGVMMGPLRRALRRASILADIEAVFEDFKEDNVPVTEEYGDKHDEGPSWGRMSARVHTSDLSDPLELGYRNYGIRISSSQSFLRLGYDLHLFDKLSGSIRWKAGYGNDVQDHLRADLEWRFDNDNYVHLTAGDDLTYLGGPTAYSLLDSPMDGSRGMLFYVEHMF